MALKLDQAIIEALSLDGEAKIASHGRSGFSATFKITSILNGQEKLYFVKTSTAKDAEIMFAGEHTSLNAIHTTIPSFCPKSYAHGPLSAGGYYLATDFLDLNHPSATSSTTLSSTQSFATKLAKLHSTPAPIPEGFSTPQFGFPLPTCCGSTIQPNTYSSSWADFYANFRLRAIGDACKRRNGVDSELAALIEETASVVVPRLLGDGHLKGGAGSGKGIVPVVVHGDLWSGNHGRGRIGKGEVEEVVFDAAGCWAHSEFELGIMKMFGGFGGEMGEYHNLKPKDDPVEEYEDRVELYELYHHLNHNALFGGGHRSGAVAIMKRLIQRYGR